MPVVDLWDRDQWGRLVPGACVRFATPPSLGEQVVLIAYVTEDLSAYYSSEDGLFIYVPEP